MSTESPPPSSSPHFSRRDFLVTTVTTGAALGLAACTAPSSSGEAAAEKTAPVIAGGTPSAITLHINGEEQTLALEPRVTLLDTLREHLHLTGTKKGCDHGQCGACTVLINGIRVNSCLTLAVMHQNHKITTIEGLADGEFLHPVQAAFIEHDAFQCGYCTPGQICSAVGLINEGHAQSDDDIRELMSGNICRCGAYPNIIKAVRQAMKA